MIACVVWYNSRPELLDRLLCSLIGRVTGAVFLDGPYKGLAEEPQSPEDNYQVFDRYRELLEFYVYPGVIYESEARKRTLAARYALEMFPRQHRLLVIDNDEALISSIPDGYPLTAGLYQEGTITSRMVRVLPLTTTITWGPHNSVVTDGGTVYWEPEQISRTHTHDFNILHTPADKRIQKEYDAYNASVRPGIEG